VREKYGVFFVRIFQLEMSATSNYLVEKKRSKCLRKRHFLILVKQEHFLGVEVVFPAILLQVNMPLPEATIELREY